MEGLALAAVLDIAGLVIIWFVLRARISRALEIDGLLSEARKEARLLTIEINETTDRNITLIEDRLAALRDLLAEADRRMGVMRRETGRRQTETDVYSRLGRRVPVGSAKAMVTGESMTAAISLGEGSASEATDSFREDSRDLVSPAGAEADDGKKSETGSVPHVHGDPVPLPLPPRVPDVITAPTSVIPPRGLRDRAIDLHRAGFSADIIAARLGATISEIELLVSLEEGRNGAEGNGGT